MVPRNINIYLYDVLVLLIGREMPLVLEKGKRALLRDPWLRVFSSAEFE